jgi:hypothetical protein
LDGAYGDKGQAKDFKNIFGITREKIPSFLKNVFSSGIIVSNKKVVRYGKEGYERIYAYNGQYVILTAIGTNGFVVTAYSKRKENA